MASLLDGWHVEVVERPCGTRSDAHFYSPGRTKYRSSREAAAHIAGRAYLEHEDSEQAVAEAAAPMAVTAVPRDGGRGQRGRPAGAHSNSDAPSIRTETRGSRRSSRSSGRAGTRQPPAGRAVGGEHLVDLATLGTIAELLGALGVIVSLVYLANQVQHAARLGQEEAARSVMTKLNTTM